MASRALDSLLAEIDPLSYRQRLRLLASRARGLAADGALARLDAEATTAFERGIVLFLGIVARDGAIVARALHDEDFGLRSRALDACRHVPIGDDELVALIADTAPVTRKGLYALIRRKRLTGLADGLLPEVLRLFSDREAAALLPACSPETVRRELPRLRHAITGWRPMALAHPGIVLASGHEQLAQAPRAARHRWWWREGHGVSGLAETHPDQVFELLERYPPEHFPHSLAPVLAALGRHDTRRLFDLLDRPEQEAARWLLRVPCVLRQVRRVPVPWLAGFLRRHDRELKLRDLILETLPPSSRGELFDLTRDHYHNTGDPVPETTLALLPRDIRTREARRSLQAAKVRESEEKTLRYTAFLPFDEAEPVLIRAASRHLAEERAAGYELLVHCAARQRDREAVRRMLATLRRMRNEQDPVRSRVIGALSSVPAEGFEETEVLAGLTRDVVSARDSSAATRHALGQLAVRLLAHRSGDAGLLVWAISTLDELYGTGRPPPLWRLDHILRRGQEEAFFSAVRPWLAAGMARANFGPLFVTARALGRRAWRVDGLQRMLSEAIHRKNTVQVCAEAITLWLDDPAQRSQRVETVLRGDHSRVVIGQVWQTISMARTDLLGIVLDGDGPSGRHLAKGVRWVPQHAPGVDRWLPRQHRRYADLLAAIAGDAGAEMKRRTQAIRAAASLPEAGRPVVLKYCGSANTVLHEAALGALIWTDRPAEALSILLSHVDDDHARVAVYAMGRAARFMPPSATRPIFARMLAEARKVTSRKEAVRLLSTVAPRAAMTEIASAWLPDQHRDVRAAIVSMARLHLDEAVSWTILEQAARDPERALASLVAQASPAETPSVHRERYAALIGVVCRHPDPVVARAAWAIYPLWAASAPGALADIGDAICDLGRRTVWRSAADALIALLDNGFEVADIRPVFQRLLSAPDTHDAGEERDRPERQRLTSLSHRLLEWVRRRHGQADLSGVAALGELVAARPGLLGAGLELMTGAMPIDETLPARLDRFAGLTEGRPLAAESVAGYLANRLDAEPGELPRDLIHETAIELAGRDGLAHGLLALSLARRAAATPSRWSADRDREVLRLLRRHAHPDVRERALDEVTWAE